MDVTERAGGLELPGRAKKRGPKGKKAEATRRLLRLESIAAQAPAAEPHDSAFVEPELAPPQPGISGFPLEALPPKKPTGVKRRRQSPETEVDDEDVERKYRRKLKKAGTVKELATRTKLTLKIRNPLADGDKSIKKEKPKEEKEKEKGKEKPKKEKKAKVKIEKGKRKGKGKAKANGAKKDKDENTAKPENDETYNDDYCYVCGGTGSFICCDSCPKLFHLLCCEPPIVEIPDDTWNCCECAPESEPESDVGLFGPLLRASHGQNPLEFRLPRRLRDATFLDVSTGPDDGYTDLTIKPEPPKASGAQIAGFNKNEDLDLDALYDKNGKPYLCHRCGDLGLGRRRMAACDYCPLRWHLDCLNEPVCLAKTIGNKWRCPNHIESLLPALWADRRWIRDTTVIDAALHSHFLRIVQALDFLVHHADQPYLAKNPPLQEYLQYQHNDFVSAGLGADFAKLEFTENDEDTVPDFKTPDFLQNVVVDGRVVAKTSKKHAKVFAMASKTDKEGAPFIYRVPEQSVILDFLATKRRTRDRILKEIAEYDTKKAEEMREEEEAVLVLTQLASGHGAQEPVKTVRAVANGATTEKAEDLMNVDKSAAAIPESVKELEDTMESPETEAKETESGQRTIKAESKEETVKEAESTEAETKDKSEIEEAGATSAEESDLEMLSEDPAKMAPPLPLPGVETVPMVGVEAEVEPKAVEITTEPPTMATPFETAVDAPATEQDELVKFAAEPRSELQELPTDFPKTLLESDADFDMNGTTLKSTEPAEATSAIEFSTDKRDESRSEETDFSNMQLFPLPGLTTQAFIDENPIRLDTTNNEVLGAVRSPAPASVSFDEASLAQSEAKTGEHKNGEKNNLQSFEPKEESLTRDGYEGLGTNGVAETSSTDLINIGQSHSVAPHELDELREIRRLIALKGKDALLEFLKT